MTTQRHCDFMVNVIKRAMLEGIDQEQFMKLAETAWLVLTSEREEQPSLETGACHADVRHDGSHGPVTCGVCQMPIPASKETEAARECDACVAMNTHI
jgi:hypothetical protein